jgi:hypothetical protein
LSVDRLGAIVVYWRRYQGVVITVLISAGGARLLHELQSGANPTENRPGLSD